MKSDYFVLGILLLSIPSLIVLNTVSLSYSQPSQSQLPAVYHLINEIYVNIQNTYLPILSFFSFEVNKIILKKDTEIQGNLVAGSINATQICLGSKCISDWSELTGVGGEQQQQPSQQPQLIFGKGVIYNLTVSSGTVFVANGYEELWLGKWGSGSCSGRCNSYPVAKYYIKVVKNSTYFACPQGKTPKVINYGPTSGKATDSNGQRFCEINLQGNKVILTAYPMEIDVVKRGWAYVVETERVTECRLYYSYPDSCMNVQLEDCYSTSCYMQVECV